MPQLNVSNTQYASFFSGQITRPFEGTNILSSVISSVNSTNVTSFGTAFFNLDDGTCGQNLTGTTKITSNVASLLTGILIQPNVHTNQNINLAVDALANPTSAGYGFMRFGYCAVNLAEGSILLSQADQLTATNYGLWANLDTGAIYLNEEASLPTGGFVFLGNSSYVRGQLVAGTASKEVTTAEIFINI